LLLHYTEFETLQISVLKVQQSQWWI